VTLQGPELSRSWFRREGWLEGGLRLLGALTYDVRDSELPYGVTMTVWVADGRLACEALQITQRRGGPPVTTDGQRAVTIDAYLDEIRRTLITAGDTSLLVMAPVEGVAGAFEPPDAGQWASFDRAQRPRRPMNELLPRVADVYRDALRSPDPEVAKAPTAAVAKHFHYSRGHASRLVSAARDHALLEGARPGRPGEVAPTKTKKKATRSARSAKGSPR
jgi:hypothetical protein